MQALRSWMGGGGRSHVPGTEEWMRIDSQPTRDLFSGGSWVRTDIPVFVFPMLIAAVSHGRSAWWYHGSHAVTDHVTCTGDGSD